jgi:hypothetical protein
MMDSTLQMTDRWKSLVDEGGGSCEIEINNDLSHLTADIIARTIFGSSFQKGKTIFDQLISLQKLSSQAGKYQWLPMGR